MASTATEAEKAAPPPPPPEIRAPAEKDRFALVDVVLRFLLLASALVAVVVMVTSKETEAVGRLPVPPFTPVYRTAKFNHSPAFIFFVAALSVAAFYGLITTIISFFALLKPGSHTRIISHFLIFDVLLLGTVAAAAGAAGGVAYIGLKGNKYVNWTKICNVYGDFCKHVGASIALSLVGSVVLVLLILLSVYSIVSKFERIQSEDCLLP